MRVLPPPATYAFDDVHSQLGFAIRHLDISTVRGTFDDVHGSLTVGPTLDDTRVEIGAAMASVNSGNTMRDDVLRGERFFDVDNHPTLTFTSSSIEPDGDRFQVVGVLTIRSITQPLTIDVTYNGSNVFPLDGSTHFGFSGRGTIRRSTFGVEAPVEILSDEVELLLEAQFIRPADDT